MFHYPKGTPAKDLITIGKGAAKRKVLPHRRHIELLKDFASRGHTIIVWSAGGEEWAWYVVKKLKLTGIVRYTMSKPDWYIDDLQPEEFMKGRIYYDLKDAAKDKRGHVTKISRIRKSK
jgi:phosphoserine phosphatase